tara:strand:+ start:311 stop:1441 length:1131 start_codon:yes stop_codon:yes gene_type:complete
MNITVEVDNTELKKRIVEMIPDALNKGMKDAELLSFFIIHLVSLLGPISRSKLIKHLEKFSLFQIKMIEDFVERHLDHQDITESKRPGETTKIFPRPPRYLKPSRENVSKYFLVGIGVEDQSLGNREDLINPLQRELLKKLQFDEHLRFWNVSDFESEQELTRLLEKSLVLRMDDSEWIGMQEFIDEEYQRQPSDFVEKINSKLEAEGIPSSRLINGEVLDPNTPSNYYLGRWKEITDRSNGKYILRSGQDYNKTYRYAEIRKGEILKQIGLYHIWNQNLKSEEAVALMIQKAIDFVNKNYQKFQIQEFGLESLKLNFFHRNPYWITRKLNAIAIDKELIREKGDHHLISYEIPLSMKQEVIELLKKYWLTQVPEL